VTTIECVKVDKSRLGTRINQENELTISDHADTKTGIPSKSVTYLFDQGRKVIEALQPGSLSQNKHGKFIDTITKLHSFMLMIMERNLIKANRTDLPAEYQLDYPKNELESSQALSGIERDSKEARSRDGTTIITDIGRGVTFNGKVVSGAQEAICSEIETLTGDKISQLGSMANKIYNFGGQFFQAALSNEFAFVTELNGIKVFPQVNRGQIDWRKTPEGKIEANIVQDVFSVNVGGNFYILDTEGTGLAPIDMSQQRGEDILHNLLMETTGSTRQRAPIGTMKASIELVGEKDNYFLRVKQATIKYNTDEVKSIRQQPQPTVAPN
jgi:hypothetical protein